MRPPTISVILPVYNGEAYVQAAVDSILSQTFRDFELIIVDDGSRDRTPEILAAIRDPRVRVVRQGNAGLAAALNVGLALAHGRYIARQDHDDLSLPQRFEKQVTYLDDHPDCALLGTHSVIWVGDKPDGRGHWHPSADADLRYELLFDSFFVHGSVMMRREVVQALGGYTTDPARQPPEDYELWSRIARQHKVANLPEALVVYREVPGSITRTVSFNDKLAMLCAENLAFATGRAPTDATLRDIAGLLHAVPNMVSKAPSLRAMRAALETAARHIEKETGGDVSGRMRATMARLERLVFLRRMERLPLPLRKVASRLLGLIRKFRARRKPCP